MTPKNVSRWGRGAAVALYTLMLLNAPTSARGQAESVFDDTEPGDGVPSRDSEVDRAEEPADPRAPDAAAPEPADDPPAAQVEPPKPRPQKVPAAAAVAEAEKLVRATFAKDYAKRDPAARRGLAEKLLKQAADEPDGVIRFVLFREARETARRAGDTATALRAVDEAAKLYAIDRVGQKLEVLSKAKPGDLPGMRTVAIASLALAGEAMRSGEPEAAAKAANVSVAAAKKCGDARLLGAAQSRAAVVREAAKWAPKVAAARKRLAEASDDRQARETLGRFACFVKEDWDAGLATLAKSADAKLAAAAARDAAEPGDVAGRTRAGDTWWDLAGTTKPALDRRAMRRRAATWYRAALPDVRGLSRAGLEHRLREVANEDDGPPAGSYDVTHPHWRARKVFSPNGDVTGPEGPVGGRWTWNGWELIIAFSGYAPELSTYPDGKGGYMSNGSISLAPAP